MLWKGSKVNISNYLDVFKSYSRDIKEVIRSAILDDTPIQKYVELYKNDPYMLWQIKMALDEGVEETLLGSISSGRIVYKIRELNNKGINIKPFYKYFKKDLSDSHYDYIIKWYREGFVLDKYDFEILPSELLEIFDYGISLGYDMSIFNNGVNFSRDYILHCVRILANKKNISIFLDGKWDIENLAMLSKYAKSRYYDKMIPYITKDITPSIIEEFYSCCRVGMSLEEIALVEDGVYVYSPIHISKIRDAFVDKLDYKQLLNVELSIKEINDILTNLKYNSSKKISGRLRKK